MICFRASCLLELYSAKDELTTGRAFTSSGGNPWSAVSDRSNLCSVKYILK